MTKKRELSATISNFHISGGHTAIKINAPGGHVKIEGGTFQDTVNDIVVPAIGRLDVSDCEFAKDEKPEEPAPAKPTNRKYFSGFSFSKGDHLK